MDKNKKKQKNVGPIKRYMENKVKKNTLEAIKRFRNKYHEEPSAEQKRKIYINEQKKLMRENKRKFNRLKLRIAAGALSISAFLAGMQFQKINNYYQLVHLEMKLLQKLLMKQTNLEIV